MKAKYQVSSVSYSCLDTFHKRITWLDSKCKNKKQELVAGYLRPILESKGMHQQGNVLEKGKMFGNWGKNVQDFKNF